MFGGQKEQLSRLELEKLVLFNHCSTPTSFATTPVKTITYYGPAHMVLVAISETGMKNTGPDLLGCSPTLDDGGWYKALVSGNRGI